MIKLNHSAADIFERYGLAPLTCLTTINMGNRQINSL